MTPVRDERRLAAIMAADMVGYSRLMEADESGTIARQRAHRAELIDPKINEYRGRIVKTMGDGLLVEFASSVDAVACGLEIQSAMSEREADIPSHRRIEYRIGVNIGDVVIEGDDILGDGVNIAARLQGLAEAGGISVSGIVYQAVEGKLDLHFKDAGEQFVKNLSKPVRVWQWVNDLPRDDPAIGVDHATLSSTPQHQQIRFCAGQDGAQIAYAVVGEGPAVLKAPNWFNHLEYDWQAPVWRHLLREIAADFSLVRFDQRGTGISDWDPPEITFENMIDDMASVSEAAGLTEFPLLGISQGCAYSIAFAARYPEKVTRLVLYAGYAKGWMRTGAETDQEKFELQKQMIRQGWGQENPAFRQFFTSQFMPDATKEQMDWFNELQRETAPPENAVKLMEVTAYADVTPLLEKIKVPTLVLHCRGDARVPFDSGRKMATMIPGARFVPLEGRNHLILEAESAWPHFINEIKGFLAN